MVAPDTVRRHLDLLAEFTTELRELQREGEESYAARDAYAGRYLVQSAAQTCIDLANHVVASEGWRNPIDYRDAFAVLGENGVLSGDLVASLQNLAGLRNRLVHVYGDIDDHLVFEALEAGLSDLDRFAAEIAKLIS